MSVTRKWVLYSTILGAFCNRFVIVVGGVNIFYFYFVCAFNFALLVSLGYAWFPRRLRWFIAYLLGSGVLGLLLATNSMAGFLKSFIGICFFACYTAAFVHFFRFEAVQLFRVYARFALYSAFVGFLLLPLPGSSGRVTGIFLEPSGFAIVCVPAVFYYADEWQRNRRYGLRLLIMLAACIMTFSSVGFIGMMLGIFLFGLRYRVGRVFVPPVVVLVFALAWTQSQLFQQRMGDLVAGLNAQDLASLNESSFGVVANTFITERQFAAHPILGGGLGSYIVAHGQFLDSLPGALFFPENFRTLGQWDASSLILRIIAELGIVGVLGTAWFLWVYFPRGGSAEERAVSMALLCYIFMKFCRSGEYFGAEQYLFLSIYTVIGAKVRLRVGAKQTALSAGANVAADDTPRGDAGMVSAPA